MTPKHDVGFGVLPKRIATAVDSAFSVSSARPTMTATAPLSIDHLQAQLLEKDELVALLTDRLEQAVDRLDRLKRAGVKAKSEAPASGLSLEVERLVFEWDQAAIPTVHERIESQLVDLRRLLSERFDRLEQHGVAVDESPLPESSVDSGGSEWEKMKAALLAGDETSPETPAIEQVAAEIEPLEVPEEPTLVSAVPQSDPDLPDPDPLPPAPAALAVDECDRETLAEAVRVRDAYIVALSQRALDRRVKLTQPTDWELLRGTPGELIKSVQRLHDELDEAVRMAEVQLCLERAKLSRERTELDQLRSELTLPSSEPEIEETVKERRWRRMLGGK